MYVIKKRLVTAFFAALLLFLIMITRLGYVQFEKHEDLKEKAEGLWTRDIVYEAERGKIVDREGRTIVGNQPAPSVIVVPRQVKDKETTAETLAHILQMSKEKAYRHVTNQVSMERIHPEGRKITEEQVLKLREERMEGVYIAKDYKRKYPEGAFLSHVVGFSGIDNQGLAGLEAYYNDRLEGEAGSLSFYSDAKGKRLEGLMDKYNPPEDGQDLKLTINRDIQEIVERELDISEATYNPDGQIAIAMDPGSGEILAMASRPTFHPGEYSEVDPSVYNRNLPVWSTYEPGSTFKIITLAAALQEDVVDLHNGHFHDPGHVKVNGAKLRCWKGGGHGSQSFLEVVQNSCNPGFVELGERLGVETLYKYIKDFGFGKQTGIDLSGEAKGILFKEDAVGPIELATTSFGQGVSVTPIQQVAAVSAAVNGGTYFQPFIRKAWIDSETGEEIQAFEPKAERKIIDTETSLKIREALESVVAKGTGRSAFIEGYPMGGKTGTAQKVGPDGTYMTNNHIVSFIGFAPADDPEIVVYVAVDNPKDTVQFGGVVAAPIVKEIMEDSLRAMGIEEREDQLEKDYTWTEEEYVEVPDITGESKSSLSKLLTPLRVEAEGEGDRVFHQAPRAGVKVPPDTVVRVYLSD
ncbi:stage V sporulation protein D [Salimicrobium halophilum]|uniref:serine-type D-Ala-D-Ala carboxypeptidase n=1 Tax=Salimicrobium halophilum TaxID=86666 RepID=A0A1G8QFV6_9BACI|nr:stage V sporulation protein D [Salimicrobium halophilum]SDJ03652.1 stage V sporulation protein D (sporulation-specific penicillin-binding protein) [Salimicrobium halophilum]